jgi:hydrogenase maturation protease
LIDNLSKTLVLGIGNPILKDDGIGLRVVEKLKGSFSDPRVTFLQTTLAGLNLLDLLSGFDAIIVDAIQTGGRLGQVYRFSPQDFMTRHEFPYLHNIDFFQTLLLGRMLTENMPEKVVIVAIEVKDVSDFGEGLTPEVESAIPDAVDQVLSELTSE